MRKRNELNYRDVKSNDGTFSPHINRTTTERLSRYCKMTNQNRTRFVEQCVNAQLDILEREALVSKSKEELIEMILGR